MIRIIGKRLIIPKGDTGTISIPNIGVHHGQNTWAVLTVYDMLYRQSVIEKLIPATGNTLTFYFCSQDTRNLEPREYYWDIKLYQNPIFDDDGFPIEGETENSYFAAYRKELPKCIIKGGV